MKINKKIKITLSIIVIFTLLSTGYIYIQNKKSIEEIPYTLFLTHVEKGLVEEVELSNNERIKVRLENGSVFITDNPRKEAFKEELLLSNIKVIEKDESLSQTIPMILTVSIMAFILFNISRNMSKQAAKEMSQMSKIDTDNKSKRLTFSDVAGNEEAKEALMDMVDFIKTLKPIII